MLYSIDKDLFTFRVQDADNGVAFMVVYSNIINGGYLRLLGGPPWPRLLNLMGRILPHLRSSNRLSCYLTLIPAKIISAIRDALNRGPYQY